MKKANVKVILNKVNHALAMADAMSMRDALLDIKELIEPTDPLVNIKKYIEQRNQSNKLWFPKEHAILLPTMTRAQFDNLMQSLEAALSPENLSCDGEMPKAQVRQRGAWLRKCQDELVAFARDANASYFGI